jgi:small subunit ribosomal protein S16
MCIDRNNRILESLGNTLPGDRLLETRVRHLHDSDNTPTDVGAQTRIAHVSPNLQSNIVETTPAPAGFSFCPECVRIGNMLKIRLQRIGRKNDPHFRLIVAPSTLKPKTSKFVEILGTFNVKQGIFEAKNDRVKHWIGMGAQVTPTVKNLLISKGVLEGKKINVLPKKTPQKKEEVKA